MAYVVHVFDDVAGTDRVVPVNELWKLMYPQSVPDDVQHSLIDAAVFEEINSHQRTRGTLELLNFDLTETPGGGLPGNVWDTLGIDKRNQFNRHNADGFRYVHPRFSRWQCLRTDWYDIDVWFRGEISPPAVPVYKLTGVHLAMLITRGPWSTAPRDFPQLEIEGPVYILGDDYADHRYIVGPPEASAQDYIQRWSITGATQFPFYRGDHMRLVWMVDGIGVDFLDFLDCRVDISSVGHQSLDNMCCCSEQPPPELL